MCRHVSIWYVHIHVHVSLSYFIPLFNASNVHRNETEYKKKTVRFIIVARAVFVNTEYELESGIRVPITDISSIVNPLHGTYNNSIIYLYLVRLHTIANMAAPTADLTNDQIDEYREAFEMFDKDGDGKCPIFWISQ